LVEKTGASKDLLDGQANPNNWEDYTEKLALLFKTRTQSQWCEILEGSDACFAPVLGVDEARNHPHLKDRSSYEEIDGIWHTAPAPRFSRTPGRIRPIAKDGAEVVARWQEKS
jgi:alpha-methylacyl-CoA racemase